MSGRQNQEVFSPDREAAPLTWGRRDCSLQFHSEFIYNNTKNKNLVKMYDPENGSIYKLNREMLVN